MIDVQGFRKFIAGKKFFSVIDLKSWFYQFHLIENARQKLGIVSPDGAFIPNLLGPKNAPAASSRIPNQVLECLDHTMGRIEDILIATEPIQLFRSICNCVGVSIEIECKEDMHQF
eukprot:TRINITY_DN6496_c0_g2_i1.p1 TRINITY_DN6496_c0_g2~~TRINITY_DN6496_c0_g2_i1.p1  ORF type:complete len:116 (+),score=29.98 TRINITY_DN6496_c0_g2_i1:778-1125(+)